MRSVADGLVSAGDRQSVDDDPVRARGVGAADRYARVHQGFDASCVTRGDGPLQGIVRHAHVALAQEFQRALFGARVSRLGDSGSAHAARSRLPPTAQNLAPALDEALLRAGIGLGDGDRLVQDRVGGVERAKACKSLAPHRPFGRTARYFEQRARRRVAQIGFDRRWAVACRRRRAWRSRRSISSDPAALRLACKASIRLARSACAVGLASLTDACARRRLLDVRRRRRDRGKRDPARCDRP